MDKPYLSPEAIEVLKKNMEMSPETWHKIMNPLCGRCLVDRYLRKREDGLYELRGPFTILEGK